MPDEFTESRTKDLREEIRKAEVGEDYVPVKVPRGYFQSAHFHKRSELERKVALRKAELLEEDLVVEKRRNTSLRTTRDRSIKSWLNTMRVSTFCPRRICLLAFTKTIVTRLMRH